MGEYNNKQTPDEVEDVIGQALDNLALDDKDWDYHGDEHETKFEPKGNNTQDLKIYDKRNDDSYNWLIFGKPDSNKLSVENTEIKENIDFIDAADDIEDISYNESFDKPGYDGRDISIYILNEKGKFANIEDCINTAIASENSFKKVIGRLSWDIDDVINNLNRLNNEGMVRLSKWEKGRITDKTIRVIGKNDDGVEYNLIILSNA